MNAGSALMICLGDSASIPPIAAATDSPSAQLDFYCQQYQRLADCWAQGLYCREWLPLQVAADKLCGLASQASTAISTATITSFLTASSTASSAPLSSASPSSLPLSVNGSALLPSATSSLASLPTPTSSSIVASSVVVATLTDSAALAEVTSALESVRVEAANVVTSIWNNDSGTDIPVISNDINPTKTLATWTHAGASKTPGSGGSNTIPRATASGTTSSGNSVNATGMATSLYQHNAATLVSVTLVAVVALIVL